MIDTLLKVVEKGIELVNIRQKNKIEYFKFVISPLFDEFEKVVAEYLKLFDGRGIDEKEAVAIREGYLQSRIKVIELAKNYADQSNDEDLIEFFESVSGFFYGSFVVPEVPRRSDGRYYIDILTGEKTFYQFSKKPNSLAEARGCLENRWEKIVGLFARLQLKYGTPIGYKA